MRVGDTLFDPATGEVHRHDGVVRLEPQPAAVLALLAARAGELVGHDELRRVVWGESTHVNFQQSLHYSIRQIRLALGDRNRSSPLIESIPRRGYRLRAPVETQPMAGPTSGGERRPRPGRVEGWPAWGALAAAAVVAVAIIERRPNDHHQMAMAVLQAVHDLVY